MSRIAQLVALVAFVYAIVVFVVVLAYLPPFVAWSVWLYRLLLAAYPAPFREEFGQEMLQVFRDTARAEYRRRGLRGLLVVWLRTLGDFSVSVVRQHREQAAAAPASSEFVLLRDLLRQWYQFGAVALSATSFSAWYGLHLVHLFFQRDVRVWATLTTIALGVWLGSFFHGIPLKEHGMPRGGIAIGMVWIEYVSEVGEPISEEQWQREVRARREDPTAYALLQSQLESRPKPWEVRFIPDILGGAVVKYKPDGKTPALIRPYKQCQMCFPFFPVPALLLLGTVRAYRRRRAISGPAMQSA